jgi:hypothetical protein
MRSRTLLLLLSLFLLVAGPMYTQTAAKPDAAGFTAEHAAAKSAGPVKACVELHYTGGGAVFAIDLTINPDVYPFTITGGSIKSGTGGVICDSPNWAVTGGSLGPTLLINAKHTGSGSCAPTLTVKGTTFHAPPSYSGTYTFGTSAPFHHNTLFIGYAACP